MREIILMSFLGTDQPGQFVRFMTVLERYGLDILDVGQSVIHGQLTLGIVVTTTDSTHMALALKEILLETNELGLTVRFKPISEDAYQQWVSEGGRTRHIVTMFAKQLTAAHYLAVSKVISAAGFNIDHVSRLSGRTAINKLTQKASAARECIELSVRGHLLQTQQLREACLHLATESNIDIAVQEDNVYRRNRRLVCFDMDSTLIEQEVIDELAKAAGQGDAVSAITEQTMRGELDFKQSFAARVKLLQGLAESELPKIANRLTLTDGTAALIRKLKLLGYKTAILSGGFEYFAKHLKAQLGIDDVFANCLDIKNGVVTGEVIGDVIDGARKAQLLTQLAKREGISLEQVIAVGDGANDLPMLSIAGLGVAFRAKPLVRENARQAISSIGLDGVLYLLGVRDDDVESEK